MYCKHCGKEIADDSKFCQHCGGKLYSFLPTESAADSKQSTDGVEIVSVPTEEPNKEENPSVTSKLFQKLGIICGIAFLAVILLGILAAIRRLSHDYIGDDFLLRGLVEVTIYVVPLILIIFFWRKWRTISIDAKYFILAIIVIIAIGIAGHCISSNNHSKVTVEQKREIIKKQILSRLPIDIDEKMSWTNLKMESDSIDFEYLIDDPLLEFDMKTLDSYQEKFISQLILTTNAAFVEQCINDRTKLNFHIISQWDYSKHEDLSLIGVELEYVYKKVSP